tara:strand:+ start:8982 stop:13706 length:4725 start_codon:yes stop_codon:yes gene_type:complete
MPELKRTFLKGRMNKDLDERLLPNGEYFDATNIQVNTSEDSDVGAIESILGNTQQLKRNSSNDLWTAGFGLTSPQCIGGIRDTQNNKIYWFITGTLSDNPANAILEYDEATDIVSVIIADIRATANQVLNFNTSNPITAINIIDGLLFFTDNLNEPRRINISTFKNSSTNTGASVATIDATTTLSNPKILNNRTVFTAEDINVIKKSPKKAPKMTLFSSLIGDGNLPGTGITPMVTEALNFSSLGTATGAIGFPSFSNQTLTFEDEVITPQGYAGKSVELRASIDDIETGQKENYVIRGTVQFASSTTLTFTPIVVPENIPDVLTPWELLIIEKDFIYKREFPRFAYRWRYNDGEYSAISPFTEPAFIPGKYNYESMDAENEGMLNHLRKIKLEFDERTTTYGPPRDVKYFEILYKTSKSNNIYVVKTAQLTEPSFQLDPTGGPQGGLSDLQGGQLGGDGTGSGNDLNTSVVFEPSPALILVDGEFKEFNITQELDGPVLESSQLLRLFDAVPRKALAQEIIANRIVYANYTEGYDENDDPIVFDKELFSSRSNQDQSGTNAQDLNGQRSIKSDKTYQLGVAFLDDFNRESPVLTNDSAVINIPKNKSHLTNSFRAAIKNTAPSWAKFFKFYIKDNYSEEYNLLLDRFYDAEDGNFWLSFPSAERNKVTEKDILVLKKKHGDIVPVNLDNEYKVIDIKNEPPEGLKLNNLDAIARAAVLPVNNTAITTAGSKKLLFEGPGESENSNFFNSIGKARALQFANPEDNTAPKNIFSKIYKIQSAGATPSATAANFKRYAVTLKDAITTGDNTAFDFVNLTSNANDHVEIILYGDDGVLGLEYQGRFFVKVEKRASFHEDVVAPSGANLAGLAVKLKTPKSATEDVQTNPPNATYPTFLKELTGAVVKAQVFKTTTLERDPITNDLVPKDFFRNRKIAQIGFTIASDNPTGEQVLANGSENLSIIYGPTNAHIDKVSPIYNAIQVGAKIRFTDGNKAGDIYTVVGVGSDVATGSLLGASNKFKLKTVELDRGYVDATMAVNAIDGIQILEDSTRNLLVKNPAVFEVKTEKNIDLDIYYEASDALPIADLDKKNILTYNNCISFGNGVESTRIADDFNAPSYGKGVRVSSILKKPFKEETRQSDLIFSGIINSRTDINNSNQFLIAENITKALNPIHGSIQKLHARDTDLIVLCEDKCFRILANKDALFNADGNANVTSNTNVLGQAVPYVGEYGISKNPESFATFGFRVYFTDKARGAVIRLSRDGITVISDQGMSDFIQDSMDATTDLLNGSYDEAAGTYNLRIGSEQISYDENSKGWATRLTYQPEFALSLNSQYYSFKAGSMWKHINATRANFYASQQSTTATVIFNDSPSLIKNFKTIFYEGDSGWEVDLETDKQTGVTNVTLNPDLRSSNSTKFFEREGKYYNFISGDALTWTNSTQSGNLDTSEFAVQGIGTPSATDDLGSTMTFTFANDLPNGVQVGDIVFCLEAAVAPATVGDIEKIGVVNIVNRSTKTITVKDQFSASLPTTSEFLFFAKDTSANKSGILGYFNKATFTNTGTGKNELFAVGTEAFISS